METPAIHLGTRQRPNGRIKGDGQGEGSEGSPIVLEGAGSPGQGQVGNDPITEVLKRPGPVQRRGIGRQLGCQGVIPPLGLCPFGGAQRPDDAHGPTGLGKVRDTDVQVVDLPAVFTFDAAKGY